MEDLIKIKMEGKEMKDKQKDIFKGLTKDQIFPHQLAFTLLIPLRNIFLSPRKLINRLGIKENHRVLEIGPGPGYFSLKIAKALAGGVLVLADIQQEMLDVAKNRLNKKGISNVDYHLCNGMDFPFRDNEFDRIFMVTVLGEIENRGQYIKEFYRILKPKGLISISEQWGDADKMSIEEIKALVTKYGFKLKKVYGNKSNFTINFSK